jgi:hypothetical protein
MAYLFQSGSMEAQLSGGMDFNYSNVETDKMMAINSDAVDRSAAAGVFGLGADGSADGALYWNGSELVVAAATTDIFAVGANGVNLSQSGDYYSIQGTSVLNATTLGAAVVASSLTSVGTLTGLTVSGDGQIQGNAILGNATSDGVAISGSVITSIIPAQDDADDLGSSTKQWKDLYIDGTAYIDALDFNGTVVSATGAELNYNDITTLGTAAASKTLTIAADSTWTVAGMTCADLGIVTTVDVNGGSIDGATIGAASQSSVKATTLSASSTLTVDGAVQINNGLTIKDAQNVVLGLDSDTAMDVDNDMLYFMDDNDSDRLKAIAIGSFLTDVAGSGLAVSSNQLTIETNTVNGALGDENKTLSVGMNYGTSSFTVNRTWTLPALSGLDNGDVVRIKCPPSLGGNKMVVAPNASDKIDDLADGKTVELMSDNASISLMRVDGTQWKIF